MARRNEAEATPALVALTRAGVAYTRHGYRHDPQSASYGEEAVAALAVQPERVFKTLLVDAGRELCVAVVPVPRSLHLKAVAASLGVKKTTLADPARAERATGYVVGAISPVAQRTRLRTVIDVSAREHATIFVSAGRRGLEVELTPEDLRSVTDGKFSPLAR